VLLKGRVNALNAGVGAGKKFQIVWLTWVIRAVGVRIIQAVLYQRPIDVGCIQVSDDLVGVMVFFNYDDDVTRCAFCFVCIACSVSVASNRVIAFWLRRAAELRHAGALADEESIVARAADQYVLAAPAECMIVSAAGSISVVPVELEGCFALVGTVESVVAARSKIDSRFDCHLTTPELSDWSSRE